MVKDGEDQWWTGLLFRRAPRRQHGIGLIYESEKVFPEGGLRRGHFDQGISERFHAEAVFMREMLLDDA